MTISRFKTAEEITYEAAQDDMAATLGAILAGLNEGTILGMVTITYSRAEDEEIAYVMNYDISGLAPLTDVYCDLHGVAADVMAEMRGEDDD